MTNPVPPSQTALQKPSNDLRSAALKPPFNGPPPAPRATRERLTYPWVLDQRQGPGNTMRVTFALPGLRQAVVTVPFDAWVDGDHLQVGAHLARTHPHATF
jgi:hypothetical protein